MKITALIQQLRNEREESKRLADSAKESSAEIITMMQSADPNNAGIEFDPQDKAKGVAYVQQNQGGVVWNQEAIIEYLRKRPRTRKACSTEMFDIGKWEANIANGTIPRKVAKRFQERLPDPAPFIRFGKKS